MSNGVDPTSGARASAAAIVLPHALLITDVRSFAERLREAVTRGAMEIDASRLAEIDTAGLQLLCATRTAALAAGHRFHWSAESARLRSAATATGLSDALGLAA